MKKKITVKLRYFGAYNGGVDGEMFQAIMPDGKVRYIGCYTWGKLLDMHWLCDAPYGYCEADYAVDENKYNLVWCDKDWNELSEKPLAWDFQVAHIKQYVMDNGIVPAIRRVGYTSDVIRKMWEVDNHGDNYVENAMYCRWERVGKPIVLHKFTWCGYKCYVMCSQDVHKYYPIIRTEFYVMSVSSSLRRTILGELCRESNDVEKLRTSKWEPEKVYPYSILRKSQYDNKWSVDNTRGYIGINIPSFKVYRAWCKDNGLRPIVPNVNDWGWYRVPFRIVELPYSTEEMPEDFTPYPIASNGNARMGGYKVEDNVVYVYRPNPNWHPVWDGIYNGVDYKREGDDYTWRAFHRFAETHVTM